MQTKRLRSTLFILTTIAAVSATGIAQSLLANVTGKWLFSVETNQGTGTPTVTFKQEGEKLTGHYSSQTLGDHDFTGTVKETKLEFKLKADVQGTALEVTYAGTIESDSTMKGTVDFGGLGGGTFTAKKQK